MSSEYLMRFLEIGVIDLKGDDTKLEKLRATAKDLSTILKKAPAKTVCFTMAAADPGIASDYLVGRKQLDGAEYHFHIGNGVQRLAGQGVFGHGCIDSDRGGGSCRVPLVCRQEPSGRRLVPQKRSLPYSSLPIRYFSAMRIDRQCFEEDS